MVTKDMTSLNSNNGRNSFSLKPIAQFVDQVPSYLLEPGSPDSPPSNNQAVVWALSRLNLLQFHSFAASLKQRRKSRSLDEFEKDISFILLQLINGLKLLQAQGIEETCSQLDRFLLARSEQDTNHRLLITEECHEHIQNPKLTLCQCALSAMLLLFDIPDPVTVATEQAGSKIELPPILPSV